MNKKRYVVLVVLGVVVVVLSAIGLKVKALADEGKLTVMTGPIQTNFAELQNGEYNAGKLELSAGKYAIYALEGYGEVTIGEKTYALDEELLLDIEEDLRDMPLAPLVTVNLYSKSPKVEIKQDMTITVKGDENFTISFLKN